MTEYKKGEKYYIEVEIHSKFNDYSCWVVHPAHPYNEYGEICVFTKDLIPIKKNKEEQQP